MPEIILPSPMVSLLVAFEPCFTAPSYRTFQLAGGRVDPLPGATDGHGGRGGVGRGRSAPHLGVPSVLQSGDRGASMRWARWSFGWRCVDPGRPAAVHPDRRHAGAQDGQGDQPGDDAPRPVAVVGPQAVLQLRARLGRAGALGAVADGREPWLRAAAAVPAVRRGQARRDQGCAGPTASRHPAAGGRAGPCGHPRPTKLALARELLALVAGWADGRTVYAVVDSAYAARPLLEDRPANVQVLSRLRPDAALWARPGRRRPGQRGRPRQAGHRLPTPKAMAATRRRWDPLPLTLYGRQVTPLVFGCTALWYGALAPPADPHRRRPRSQWSPP